MEDINSLIRYRKTESLYSVNQINLAIGLLSKVAEEDIIRSKLGANLSFYRHTEVYNIFKVNSKTLNKMYNDFTHIAEQYLSDHVNMQDISHMFLYGSYKSIIESSIGNMAGGSNLEAKRNSLIYDTLRSLENSMNELFVRISNLYLHTAINKSNFDEIKIEMSEMHFLREPTVDAISLQINYKYTANQVRSFLGKFIEKYINLQLEQEKYKEIAHSLFADVVAFFDRYSLESKKLENNLLQSLAEYRKLLKEFSRNSNFERSFLK